MNNIFAKRLKDYLLKSEDLLRASTTRANMSLTDAIRMMDETPANMLRFPTAEMTDLADTPCAGSLQ